MHSFHKECLLDWVTKLVKEKKKELERRRNGRVSLNEPSLKMTQPQCPNCNAVILKKADLDRIRDATTIKTKDQIVQEKKLADQQKQAALAKSKAKKEKMMKMDEQRAQKV